MFKILDYDGSVVNDVDISQFLNLAKILHEKMMYARLADQKAVNLQRTGLIGTYPSSMGQEAIDVAAGLLLREQDVFVPYYRDQAILLHRGYTFADILEYWGGSEDANARPNNKDFPVCVPIATQYTHAAGIGVALKSQKTGGVVLVTGGEGSTSKGDFYEALNVASLWNLPVVFLIKNNQWAISTPSVKQTKVESFADKADAVGMEKIQVDGNDGIAMCKILDLAFIKARSGNGPTLIEAVTYRLGDHTTADDANRYRSKDQLKKAWEREPIKRLKSFLVDNDAMSDSIEATMATKYSEHINKQVELYKSRKKSRSVDDMFVHMYEDTSHLSDQIKEAKDE